jgi:adenylate cyclase
LVLGFQYWGLRLTEKRVQRRLAAVLAADVAGYSRLMQTDEEGTLARLKTARRTLIDPAIASHGGRIVKTTGDGMLVEFASAVDAARCAVEVQRAMATPNPDMSPQSRIELRIGIHVGDIIIDEDDIFGDGVNIAARLEAIAEPSGICISDDAHRQIRGKADIVFDDMGFQSLKNIAEPMRVWRGRPGGIVYSTAAENLPAGNAPLALLDKPSIAVLPFQNMSGDQEQEYFADGMVEDIITGLSRSKLLFVIARNSTFTYKGKAVDIRQVGRELGVRYVLEGSVRTAGKRVRVTAQLIDTSTDAHIWADKFDSDLEDVFELQDRLTSTVIGAISPQLEPRSSAHSGSRRRTCKPMTIIFARCSPSTSNHGMGTSKRSGWRKWRPRRIQPLPLPIPLLLTRSDKGRRLDGRWMSPRSRPKPSCSPNARCNSTRRILSFSRNRDKPTLTCSNSRRRGSLSLQRPLRSIQI